MAPREGKVVDTISFMCKWISRKKDLVWLPRPPLSPCCAGGRCFRFSETPLALTTPACHVSVLVRDLLSGCVQCSYKVLISLSPKKKQAKNMGFQWSEQGEPHAIRRRAILDAHPEIKSLMGHDTETKYKVGCVLGSCALALLPLFVPFAPS